MSVKIYFVSFKIFQNLRFLNYDFRFFSLFFRLIEFRNFGFEIKMDIFGWKFEIFVNFESDSRYKY